MRGRTVITAAAMLAAASMTVASAAPASVGQPLAAKLDTAFRACASHLTQPTYLTAGNRELLGKAGIALAAPPAEVRTMAARLFGDEGIYASVAVPTGTMWIAASATVAACKVTLADTELALSGRYEWTTQLRSSKAWQFDRARSGQNAQIMRDFFVLNPERAGAHMVMFVDGPNTIANDGKGIQLIITVALEPAKAP